MMKDKYQNLRLLVRSTILLETNGTPDDLNDIAADLIETLSLLDDYAVSLEDYSDLLIDGKYDESDERRINDLLKLSETTFKKLLELMSEVNSASASDQKVIAGIFTSHFGNDWKKEFDRIVKMFDEAHSTANELLSSAKKSSPPSSDKNEVFPPTKGAVKLDFDVRVGGIAHLDECDTSTILLAGNDWKYTTGQEKIPIKWDGVSVGSKSRTINIKDHPFKWVAAVKTGIDTGMIGYFGERWYYVGEKGLYLLPSLESAVDLYSNSSNSDKYNRGRIKYPQPSYC